MVKMPALVFSLMEHVSVTFFFFFSDSSLYGHLGVLTIYANHPGAPCSGGTRSTWVICPPGPQWTPFWVPGTCFPGKHQPKFFCFL